MNTCVSQKVWGLYSSGVIGTMLFIFIGRVKIKITFILNKCRYIIVWNVKFKQVLRWNIKQVFKMKHETSKKLQRNIRTIIGYPRLLGAKCLFLLCSSCYFSWKHWEAWSATLIEAWRGYVNGPKSHFISNNIDSTSATNCANTSTKMTGKNRKGHWPSKVCLQVGVRRTESQ